MKKYERVNLASDIYRQKQPTKLQLNNKAYQLPNQDQNSKNYISACCPNCKYLFKVLKQKQNERSKSTNNIKGRQEEKLRKKWYDHLIKPNDKEVQTQPIVISPVRTSPKRQRFKHQINRYTNVHTEKNPERVPYFDIKQVEQSNPLMTDRLNNRSPSPLQTSRKKQISSKSNQKISNLIQKSKPKPKQTFPVRTAYINNTQPQIHISNRQEERNQNHSPSFAKNQITKGEKELESRKKQDRLAPQSIINSKITKQLVNKIRLTEEINQIIQYHMNLPAELSVPSYCKMLVYDIQQKKQRQRQQELQQQERAKHFQDQFYNARYSQLKSKYEKNKTQNPKY